MKLKSIILSALVLGSVSVQANICQNTIDGYSVCELASSWADNMAEMSPRKINKYLTITGGYSFRNHVVITAKYDVTKAKFNSLFPNNSFRHKAYVADKAQVCADGTNSQYLLNNGLSVEFAYSSNEGKPLFDYTITSCN